MEHIDSAPDNFFLNQCRTGQFFLDQYPGYCFSIGTERD